MTVQIEDTAKLHHATRKKAERLNERFADEYPALSIDAVYNAQTTRVVGWMVSHRDAEGEDTTVYEGVPVPDIDELLEACADQDLDPTDAFEDDEEEIPSGSVVPDGYRKLYREASSTKQSCGDWLAEQLAMDTHSDGIFMQDDFQAILDNNQIDQQTAWGRLPMSGQKGWVGRWRMNGRQALAKQIALTGVYKDTTGNEIEPDEGWLSETRAKHAKWLAKQKKIEEAHKPE